LTSPLRASKLLAQRIEHLRAFRNAYQDLVNRAIPLQQVGSLSLFLAPREGDELAFGNRMAEVAELAGAAYAAAGEYQAAATKFGRSYVPLLQWRDPFDYDGGLAGVDDILDACDTILGVLRVKLDEAKATEHTAAFRIGWFLRFPERARDAAGPSASGRRIAFWGSLVLQVVTSLIAAGIIAGGGYLIANRAG
jgi:hypothetical protein